MCDHEKFMPPRRAAANTDAPAPKSAGAVKWVLPAAAALVGAMLLFEHREHWADIAPWLLVAACPLLHLFMHRGHK